MATSSGNICGPWERWHQETLAGAEASEAGTGRDAPALALAESLALTGPVATLSVACASGTAMFAVAQGWLARGLCERVICAGVDAASRFVHAGFSVLGALASEHPQPFTDSPDGLVLGDGAAAVVLGTGTGPFLRGVGLSCDGVHLTAPDRTGAGLARALRQAMSRADCVPDAIGAHGTGTLFNDGMERAALKVVFDQSIPPVHVVKPAIGHTTGAAGAIEAVVALQSLSQGALPTVFGGPGGPIHSVAILSAAFGGVNAAAVFSAEPGPPIAVRATAVSEPRSWVVGDLAEHWPDAPVSVRRSDAYSRGVLVALHHLFPEGAPTDIALVLASKSGCRIQDLLHHERLLANRPSPRAFAATIPSFPLAQATVLWGLHGPLLTFVGDVNPVDEAKSLVALGFADRAIALVCEAPNPNEPAQVRAWVVTL